MTSTDPPKPLPFADVLPPELEADTQALIESLMTGKPLDPEVYRRIKEEGERARVEYEKRNGITDIAVELIRETRDAE